MYDAVQDLYCYPGTTVLKNRLNLRTQAELDAFETEIVIDRSGEALPDGSLNYSHYKAIHRHLFQDVYEWAGQERTVRISKGGSMFCYPENIASEADKLFGALQKAEFLHKLPPEGFATQAAHFLAELNAIHPFREGNGRTQLSFLILLAEQASHPLDLDRMEPEAMLAAMIASFEGDENALRDLIDDLILV